MSARTPAELLAAAHALVPALRERGARCEAGRRLPQETLDELREAGLLRAMTPRRYGGSEPGWDVLCDLIMELASGCGSTGWVYAVVGQHPLVANLFGAAVMDEIWGESPDALISSSRRISGGLSRTSGGYTASGVSTFSSGCLHAGWVVVDELPLEGANERRSAILPKQDVEVLDTWNVMGLCGTGSHDVRFDKVFIPEHRVRVQGAPPAAGALDTPMFRLPGNIVPFTLCSVLVGIAAGALEQFTESIRGRSSRQGVRIAGLQSLQMRVGESAVEIEAAKTFIRAKLRDLMARLNEGLPVNDPKGPPAGGDSGADLHASALSAYAMQLALQSVERIFYAAGASELQLGGNLQRCFRDAVAGSRQFGHNWDHARTRGGRTLLGLD